jgi:hypothetical protein
VRRIWRSGDEVAGVVDLITEGLDDRAICDRTGIPIGTIRTWRRGQVPRRAIPALAGLPSCDHCGERAHDYDALPVTAYAYLLGMYLGDGCIYRSRNGMCVLKVSLDAAYPGIVTSAREAIVAVRGGGLPHAARDKHCACIVITSYWRAWSCLFPQHGRGRKHQRPIELVDWQRALVDAAPEAFLRALMHTDGWRGLNRVRTKGRDYAYPRYQFSNRSADIRRLFTDVCDQLGVAWRPWGRSHISVAHRDAVATLDRFIGPKA